MSESRDNHDSYSSTTWSDDDIRQMVEIEEQSYPPDHCFTHEDFVNFMREDSFHGVVVSTLESKMLGFLIYREGSTAWTIWDIAVHPDCRRLGIGSQLVDTTYTFLLKDNLKRQRLLAVVPEESDSLDFFDDLGFTPTSSMSKGDDEDDDTSLIMCLEPSGRTQYVTRLEPYFRSLAMEH